jgi:hypothetical protein
MEMAFNIEMASGVMFARQPKTIHTEDQSQISIFWYTNNKVKEDNCPYQLSSCTPVSRNLYNPTSRTKSHKGVCSHLQPINAHSNTFPYFNTKTKVIRFPAPSEKHKTFTEKLKHAGLVRLNISLQTTP